MNFETITSEDIQNYKENILKEKEINKLNSQIKDINEKLDGLKDQFNEIKDSYDTEEDLDKKLEFLDEMGKLLPERNKLEDEKEELEAKLDELQSNKKEEEKDEQKEEEKNIEEELEENNIENNEVEEETKENEEVKENKFNNSKINISKAKIVVVTKGLANNLKSVFSNLKEKAADKKTVIIEDTRGLINNAINKTGETIKNAAVSSVKAVKRVKDSIDERAIEKSKQIKGKYAKVNVAKSRVSYGTQTMLNKIHDAICNLDTDLYFKRKFMIEKTKKYIDARSKVKDLNKERKIKLERLKAEAMYKKQELNEEYDIKKKSAFSI